MIRLHGDEMERLICALGGTPGKGRRTRCFLHGGNNPTSFSWTEDGLWYCFAEGRGGTALDLVMEAKGLDVKGALEFMADLGIIEAQEALKHRKVRKVETETNKWHTTRREISTWCFVTREMISALAKRFIHDPDTWEMYMEWNRRELALKKKLYAPSAETLTALLRLTGHTRAFFLKHWEHLTETQKKAVEAVLRWEGIIEAICTLREYLNELTTKPDHPADDLKIRKAAVQRG